MRAAPSRLVAAIRLPSGKKAPLLTVVPRPAYLANSLPLSAPWSGGAATKAGGMPSTITAMPPHNEGGTVGSS
jgi:hypothetical protein